MQSGWNDKRPLECYWSARWFFATKTKFHAFVKQSCQGPQEQMNIEQGMSKEEGSSPRKGARTRHEPNRRTDFEFLNTSACHALCGFSRFLWPSLPTTLVLLPSTFLVRHSSVQVDLRKIEDEGQLQAIGRGGMAIYIFAKAMQIFSTDRYAFQWLPE